jgi:hypothetical protein
MIDAKTGIDFPFFQSQLYDIFGEPNENQFARDYLRTLDFKEFAEAFSVLDYEGNPWKHRIYGNFAMEEPLRRAFSLIIKRGLAGELKTFDGCWNIRRMKGGNNLSVHSWGLAVDFNAATNQFGQQGDMSPDLIKCFTESGFESGSFWNTPDFMHFQLAWTQDWRKSNNSLAPIVWQS